MASAPASALAFAGTAPFGAAILAGLLDGDATHPPRRVELVISQPDRPAGRGRKVRSSAVAQLARERGVELLQPERMHDPEVLDRLAGLGVGTIVVAAFGQMVREPLLSNFLMLNVHGSILPEYRGAAPIERAIMDGCSETGVDIMRMDAGLDTGPVAFEGRVPIGPDDDAGTVFAHCGEVGVALLHDALDRAATGSLEFRAQSDAGATYAHKITAEDRQLDLPAMTAQAAHDRVRALSPHIGAYCEVDGQRLGLWRTRVVAVGDLPNFVAGSALDAPGDVATTDDGELLVMCGDGVLSVLEVQPTGRRRMPVDDWLRGLREPLRQVTQPRTQA